MAGEVRHVQVFQLLTLTGKKTGPFLYTHTRIDPNRDAMRQQYKCLYIDLSEAAALPLGSYSCHIFERFKKYSSPNRIIQQRVIEQL
jgi:hypothetical protein